MAELETPAVETPAVDAPVVDATTPELFGEDGNFTENWTQTLKNEALHDDPTLKTIRNMDALASITVNTKRMVGKDTIAIPNDTSPKDEWSEYYRHGGRPDTAEDYGLAAPEGFPPEFAEKVFPAERIAKWQQRFFDGGVSKKAAAQFIAEFANDVLADIKSAKQVDELQLAELTNGLTTDWGDAYPQKIHFGNIAIEEGTMGDLEFKDRVVAKVQKDPDLTRLLANLGGKFTEGKTPELTNIPTPSDLQTQINELMASPILMDSKSTLAQRAPIMAKIMALRAKMSGISNV